MPNEDDRPLDLSALRAPASSNPRPHSSTDEEAFVGAVMGAIQMTRSARRTSDPLLGLRDLAVPFLAAASLIIAALAWQDRMASAARPPRTVAEAVGVPPEFLHDAADRGERGR
ncbi:MAG: hypothetical protein U0163_18790 [Gemmatimonadaceae bacterium]